MEMRNHVQKSPQGGKCSFWRWVWSRLALADWILLTHGRLWLCRNSGCRNSGCRNSGLYPDILGFRTIFYLPESFKNKKWGWDCLILKECKNWNFSSRVAYLPCKTIAAVWRKMATCCSSFQRTTPQSGTYYIDYEARSLWSTELKRPINITDSVWSTGTCCLYAPKLISACQEYRVWRHSLLWQP